MKDRVGWGAVAALAGYILLACVFFWPLLFTNTILTGYDTFTIFYPHRTAAARALLSGHLPLWNPDHFLGAPLLANPQVAVLYPLNWPFLAMPPGPSLAWTMALHFVLAGFFAYTFGSQAACLLSRQAAWLAGAAFAFGGFMGQQTGHLNQVSVAAWLPLVLLLSRKTWQKPDWRHIVALGVVTSLHLLAGHSQESYMILATLVAYVLHLGIQQHGLQRMRSSLRQLAAIAVAVVIGVGLSAIQLLPTLELSRLSIRSGGLSFRQASSFSLNPQDLPLALLPNYVAPPPNEMAGHIGVAALLLAVIGTRWHARRQLARFLVILASLALLMALGRYTPVYWAAYYVVPGVALFRVPARWLCIYSFAIAVLAGMGLDVILASVIPRRRVLQLIIAAVAAVATCLAIAALFIHLPAAATMLVWMGVALILMSALAIRFPARQPFIITTLVLALTITELYAAGRHLEYNRYSAPESLTSLRPAIAYLQTQIKDSLSPEESVCAGPPARVLSISDATWDPGDLHEIKAGMTGLATNRVADYLAAIKNKELLTANLPGYFHLQSADGYDGGVLPLSNYVNLQGLFLPVDKLSPDGRLRDHLQTIPEARLLSLLDITYIITDKNHDVWLDDVYYDLAFATPVTESLTLVVNRPFIATAVGLISRLEETSITSGTIVGQIVITDPAGNSVTADLVAGQETAAIGQSVLRAVSTPADGPYYQASVLLPKAINPDRITVRYQAGEGTLALRALSLIDHRTGASQSVVVTNDFSLVHTGDVKVYRNKQSGVGRAYIVHQARVLSPSEDAVAAMRSPSFAPATHVILTQAPTVALSMPDGPETVCIRSYTPERIVVETKLASPGILVLSDASYPGWRAGVDGADTPILQANHSFRGIELSAGSHHVELVYEPRSLWVGGAITLVTTVAVVYAGIFERRRIKTTH